MRGVGLAAPCLNKALAPTVVMAPSQLFEEGYIPHAVGALALKHASTMLS